MTFASWTTTNLARGLHREQRADKSLLTSSMTKSVGTKLDVQILVCRITLGAAERIADNMRFQQALVTHNGQRDSDAIWVGPQAQYKVK